MEGNRASRGARSVVVPPANDVDPDRRRAEANTPSQRQRSAVVGEDAVNTAVEGRLAAHRIEQLARSFQALRHAPHDLFDPWDPLRFADYYRTGSSGEKD